MCVLFPVSKMTIFNTIQQQSQEHKKVFITGQVKLNLSTMQSNAWVLVNIHSVIRIIYDGMFFYYTG